MNPPPEPQLLQGLDLLLRREWFEAHEVLEELWQPHAPGDRRELLQGLIQIAVALEHLRRGNPQGAFAVWSRGQARLRKLPDSLEGIHHADWLTAIQAFFTEVDLAGRVRAQLEGAVAADAEAGHQAEPDPLPPADQWPVPALDASLAQAVADLG